MPAKHAIWIALALSTSASAQVYRCDGPDGTIFSQVPCAADAKEIETPWALEPRRSQSPSGRPNTTPPAEAKARPEAQQVLLNWCRDQWPSDFRMQEYCFEKQKEAAGEVSKLHKAAAGNPALELVMVQCANQWKIPGGQHDWRMVRYCTERQFQSYERLK